MDGVKLLYSDPIVKVLRNNTISKPILIRKGCHQGCPLSPLLFTIAIEPLAIAVRFLTEISGIIIDHHNALYADDIIVFLRNLEVYSNLANIQVTKLLVTNLP